MATNNENYGIVANPFSTVMVSNSIITHNGTALLTAAASSLLRVAGTAITANGTGLLIAAGTLASFGNNALEGNGTDGAFNTTIPLE